MKLREAKRKEKKGLLILEEQQKTYKHKQFLSRKLWFFSCRTAAAAAGCTLLPLSLEGAGLLM
jgi:hypothetical protein